MYYTLYKTTNNINGKIYIGVHKTKNLNDDYFGSGKILKRAIKKYGIENFTKEILACFDNPDDMFKMESELVNEEFVKQQDNYNIKIGGFGGWDHLNDGSKNHINRAKKGGSITEKNGAIYKARQILLLKRKNDKKWSQNISKKGLKSIQEKYPDGTWKNRHHKEESKQKIGEANSKHQKGKGNSQYGTMWIYCPYTHENKKISKFELTQWEKDGWVKGRKIKP